MESNDVLYVIAHGLQQLGFEVEQGKAKAGKLPRPVFFGDQGTYIRTYEIDAFEPSDGIALEVEAGRATMGNAIYRDLIQASLMLDARFGASGSNRVPLRTSPYTRAELREDVLSCRGRIRQSTPQPAL
jgi:hypothetical protein